MIEVIATKKGFYAGVVRAKGDTFEVASDAKASWFAPLKEVKKPNTGGKKAEGKGEPDLV